jgi:TPR repeat protein
MAEEKVMMMLQKIVKHSSEKGLAYALAVSDYKNGYCKDPMRARNDISSTFLMLEWDAEIKKAADQTILGVVYNNGFHHVAQDYTEAAKWYRLAAEQDYAQAQNNLGEMYHEGLGVPQDYIKAAEWYRLAAEQGLAEAQNNLGWMYENNLGVVSEDGTIAVQLYRRAAEQGLAAAQYNFGRMYQLGQGGVEKDIVKAYMWFNLAAAQGHEEARQVRDELNESLTREQVLEGQRLARQYFDENH